MLNQCHELKRLLIIEPQNTEQGMSNFEVFFLTSAVRYFLFDIYELLENLLKLTTLGAEY